MYADILTLQCKNCSSPCLNCHYKSTYCISCDSTSSLILLQNNSCVSQCSTNYTYPATSIPIPSCISCQSPCLTCSSQTACLSCISGYRFSGNQCSTSCVVRYYFNSSSTSCQQCSPNCIACTSATFCQSCASNYFINSLSHTSNDCVSSCPSGFYNSILSGSCQSCIYPCSTCTSDVDCLTCQNGIFYAFRCISSCP